MLVHICVQTCKNPVPADSLECTARMSYADPAWRAIAGPSLKALVELISPRKDLNVVSWGMRLCEKRFSSCVIQRQLQIDSISKCDRGIVCGYVSLLA